MGHIMKITLAVVVLFLVLGLLPSDAWSLCAIDRQLELSAQGLTQDEIRSMCGETAFAKAVPSLRERGAANAAGEGLSNQLQAISGSDEDSQTLPSRNSASFCRTSYGTCPLSGGSPGSPCHCPGWNGYLFTGVSH